MRIVEGYFDSKHRLNLESTILMNFLANLDTVKKVTKNWQRITVRARKGRQYARQRKRLPAWSDLAKVTEIYADCPKTYTIDHIIPMCAEKASGLHVPNNLQYMKAKANSLKGNTFTPFREVGGEIVEYYG